MTDQEIKDAIRFNVYEARNMEVDELTATFTVSYSIMMRRGFGALDEAKANAQEAIVRKIFDDQRRALAEKITDLYKINPMDFSAWHEKIDEIMGLAKYQPPT